jgi:hypothetical protein
MLDSVHKTRDDVLSTRIFRTSPPLHTIVRRNADDIVSTSHPHAVHTEHKEKRKKDKDRVTHPRNDCPLPQLCLVWARSGVAPEKRLLAVGVARGGGGGGPVPSKGARRAGRRGGVLAGRRLWKETSASCHDKDERAEEDEKEDGTRGGSTARNARMWGIPE